MGNVHRLPSADDAEREASEWVVRMQAHDVTDDDRTRFQAWMGAHPCNAKAYAELCATWHELVKSGPLVRAVYFGQVMNAASTPPAPRRRWAIIAMAAGVAAVILGGAWDLYRQKQETGFQTAIGERASVSLPDGSSVDLNTNSRVRVDYGQRARVILLERGEAFFKVAHDTRRPFWVRAGDSWVRAVGTAFNVYLRPTGPEVTVSEGTVNVVSATSNEPPPSDTVIVSAASVTAGEQVAVQGRAKVIRELNSVQLNRLLAWRSSSLYFEDQPLGDVAGELMRYTTLKIDISDGSLRELPIGGTFQASPEGAEALLTTMQDGFGMTIRRDRPGHAYIEGPAR
jgi:transmembrane sensor